MGSALLPSHPPQPHCQLSLRLLFLLLAYIAVRKGSFEERVAVSGSPPPPTPAWAPHPAGGGEAAGTRRTRGALVDMVRSAVSLPGK